MGPKGRTKIRWEDDPVNGPQDTKINNWIESVRNRKDGRKI